MLRNIFASTPASADWVITTADASTAFLYGKIQRTVYIERRSSTGRPSAKCTSNSRLRTDDVIAVRMWLWSYGLYNSRCTTSVAANTDERNRVVWAERVAASTWCIRCRMVGLRYIHVYCPHVSTGAYGLVRWTGILAGHLVREWQAKRV